MGHERTHWVGGKGYGLTDEAQMRKCARVCAGLAGRSGQFQEHRTTIPASSSDALSSGRLTAGPGSCPAENAVPGGRRAALL